MRGYSFGRGSSQKREQQPPSKYMVKDQVIKEETASMAGTPQMTNEPSKFKNLLKDEDISPIHRKDPESRGAPPLSQQPTEPNLAQSIM
mmetsp:Transcript_39824/g.61021  ORF Transcript_39824/g.61021 Transcript_39824/m.61021 type:complete len:89 (-) Transcript_39824:904-1170(-)